MEGTIWLWIGFNLFVLFMLAIDLGVFHRKSHVVNSKEALVWSAVWITLALTFNAGIYFFWDKMSPSSAYTNLGIFLMAQYAMNQQAQQDQTGEGDWFHPPIRIGGPGGLGGKFQDFQR